MTASFQQKALTRKLKSALSALILTFFVFALLPLSQSGIFERKIQKEYMPVDLVVRNNRTTDNDPSGISAGQKLNMPSGPAGSAGTRAEAVPSLALPSDYGVASVKASEFGNIYSLENFGAPKFAGSADDFSLQAFELAQLDSVPRRLKSGRSEYPRHLYNRGVEGDVRLSLFINTDGSVEIDRVLMSSHKDFERAAVNAALSQTYEVPKKGGEAVRARFELLIPFRILK